MAIVRARVIVRGFRRSSEEIALVDTNVIATFIDRKLAEEIGVKPIGRRIKPVIDKHELMGELAIVESLTVEGEELPGAHIAVAEIPSSLAEKLRNLRLSNKCIIGASTLELLGLAANPATGRVKKVDSLPWATQ